MRLRNLLYTLILSLLAASPALGQGGRLDGMVFSRSGLPAPGATIAVCTQPAITSTTPCSVLATLYTDASLTTPCTSGVSPANPLPPNVPSSPCTNPMISDGLGNYHFYAQNGRYTLQFYGPGLTTIVQPDTTVPCDPTNCLITISGSFTRFQPILGTTLTSPDFTLTGWGTGATVTAIKGTDTAWTATVTAGTTPTINPTLKLTFHDGPWLTVTSISPQMVGGTGSFTDVSLANTLNDETLTYLDLPVATKTYIFNVITMGNSNVIIPIPPVLNPVILNPTSEQSIASFPLSAPSYDLQETATPGTPAVNLLRLWANAGDQLFFRNAAGVDTAVGGGVSSVDITPPSDVFTVSGASIGAVNKTLSKVAQTANLIYAAPCAASGVPTFRHLCLADLGFFTYTGNSTKIGTASGTFTAGNFLTTDSFGNIIDSGAGGFEQWTNNVTGTTCPTSGTSFDTCTYTMTWPISFGATNYQAVCTGKTPFDADNSDAGRLIPNGISAQTATTITYKIASAGASHVSYTGGVTCHGKL